MEIHAFYTGVKVYSIVQTEAHLSTAQLLLHCCVTLHKSGPCYAGSFSKEEGPDSDCIRFLDPFKHVSKTTNDQPIINISLPNNMEFQN